MAGSNPKSGFNRAALVALLYIFGLLPIVIGALLCKLWHGKPGNEPWEDSHFAYHLHGFKLLVIAELVGVSLAVIGSFVLPAGSDQYIIAFALLLSVPVLWLIVRALVAGFRATKHVPMPDAKAIFW